MKADVISDIYKNRFNGDTKKGMLWIVLCRFLQRYIPKDAAVLDVAAGYGEFINNIQTTGQKYAVDINSDTASRLEPGILFHQIPADQIAEKIADRIDVVFVSNFFEHLENSTELLSILEQINKSMKKIDSKGNGGGRLIVLQPNIRLVKEAYWDFLDHKYPVTEKSMIEAANLSGFQLESMILRFLPYSTCGNRLAHPFLLRLYLRLLPFSGWFFGKQTLFVFQKKKDMK